MGIGVGIGIGVGAAVGAGSGSGSGVRAGVGSGVNVGVGSSVGVGVGSGVDVDVGATVGATVWSGIGADMVGSSAGSAVESGCCPAASVGSGVGAVVPPVDADGRRWLGVTVGTGMVVNGDALDKACVGGGCVPDCAATNSAVPVGALTKMLVRPGSAPVHPAVSAIRDRIVAANGYPRLAVK